MGLRRGLIGGELEGGFWRTGVMRGSLGVSAPEAEEFRSPSLFFWFGV